MPSHRVRTSGYRLVSKAKTIRASFSTTKLTPLFSVSAPVFHVPAGTTTRPPPFREHVTMALFMAFWFCAAEALVLAPNFVMI